MTKISEQEFTSPQEAYEFAKRNAIYRDTELPKLTDGRVWVAKVGGMKIVLEPKDTETGK